MKLVCEIIIIAYLVGVVLAWVGMAVATLLDGVKNKRTVMDLKWIVKAGLLSWVMAFISILFVIDIFRAGKSKD